MGMVIDLSPAKSASVARFVATENLVAQGGRPTLAWHIDCTTGRPVARWIVLAPSDACQQSSG